LKQAGKAIETKAKTGKELSSKTLNQIRKIVKENNGKAGAPIRVLQQAQELVGYLPPEILKTISKEMRIPLSEIYGITSFYSFFSLVPKGKYVIQVCLGTACYVKGAERLIKTLKKEFDLEPRGITADSKFSLDTVRCLGACGLSPVMAIGHDIHRKVRPSKIKEILDSYD